MKSIKELLTESHRTYAWKIGVAGDYGKTCEEQIRSCMEKWSVASWSKAKKTPIQERPLDFPQLENIDVYYWDAEVKYPTTTDAIQEYIAQCCDVPASHVIVRNPEEPQELYQEKKEDTEYETMLTQEDMGGESAQADVGSTRVMDLLKELEKAKKEDGDKDYKAETPADDKMNNKAVLSQEIIMDNAMLNILKGFDNVEKKTLQESAIAECPPMGMDAGMDAQGGEISIKLDDTAQMAKVLMALQAVTSGSANDVQDAPMMPAPEEAEMEEYDNEPEEEYMDTPDILPSGDDLHRQKDMKAIRVKDPAVESIKDRLLQALEEKKKSPAGGPTCWKEKKIHPTKPTKMKGGKRVNNCIDAGS